MNNMKSYISFLPDRPLLKYVVQIFSDGKNKMFLSFVFVDTKNVVFRLKVTTHLETKTHKKDLIYSWDLETAVKHKDVLFILLK